MKKKFDWDKPMTRKDWGVLCVVCCVPGMIMVAEWYYGLFKDEIYNWACSKIKMIKAAVSLIPKRK